MSAKTWRPLIERVVRDVWPDLLEGARWVEAQVHVESRGVAAAVSTVGAKGLLQLMPGTAADMQVHNILDPEQNLRGGVKYLKIQYDHFPEVPDPMERLRWSWAAYNGGRGYVNRAFHIARLDTVLDWWKWELGKNWLMSCDCTVGGKHPDYKQMWDYVARIEAAKKEMQ